MPSSALVHPVRRKRPQEAVFASEADEVRGRPGTALNARPTGKICTCTSCASEADRRARGKEDSVRTRKRSSNRCSWRDEPCAVPDVALMPVVKATVRELKSTQRIRRSLYRLRRCNSNNALTKRAFVKRKESYIFVTLFNVFISLLFLLPLTLCHVLSDEHAMRMLCRAYAVYGRQLFLSLLRSKRAADLYISDAHSFR